MTNTENQIREMERAIQMAGGVTQLADKIGISYQAIRKWEHALAKGRVDGIPARRALEIERATDGRVQRKNLRPDLFA